MLVHPAAAQTKVLVPPRATIAAVVASYNRTAVGLVHERLVAERCRARRAVGVPDPRLPRRAGLGQAHRAGWAADLVARRQDLGGGLRTRLPSKARGGPLSAQLLLHEGRNCVLALTAVGELVEEHRAQDGEDDEQENR